MIHVLIAEDHHLVRKGIRALLESIPEVVVVGEAADGEQAVAQAAALLPDVVVMDVMMPHGGGIEALKRLALLNLPARAVMLSMYADEAIVRNALASGACGYILKTALTDELVKAVRAAAAGEIYLCAEVLALLRGPGGKPGRAAEAAAPYLAAAARQYKLTRRELDTLRLIANGYTNLTAARLLSISPRTLEKHRASLMDKLGVNDLPGLVRAALRLGLLPPEG
jgi:DNA-binding NarL/FixJ family response regulator